MFPLAGGAGGVVEDVEEGPYYMPLWRFAQYISQVSMLEVSVGRIIM